MTFAAAAFMSISYTSGTHEIRRFLQRMGSALRQRTFAPVGGSDPIVGDS
jgi:hypothetical protein